MNCVKRHVTLEDTIKNSSQILVKFHTSFVKQLCRKCYVNFFNVKYVMYKSIRKRIFIRLRPNDSKCNETCHALKHIDQHSILKVNMCRMSKLFSFTVKESRHVKHAKRL